MGRCTGTEFQVFRGRSSTLVWMAGEFDFAALAVIAGQLAELLEASPRVLVIDMGGVTFFDASGLRVLARLHAHIVAEGGGVIRIVGVPRQASRVLELVEVSTWPGVKWYPGDGSLGRGGRTETGGALGVDGTFV